MDQGRNDMIRIQLDVLRVVLSARDEINIMPRPFETLLFQNESDFL